MKNKDLFGTIGRLIGMIVLGSLLLALCCVVLNFLLALPFGYVLLVILLVGGVLWLDKNGKI